mmetsp:Transcript_7178/g.10568  ORF Transcript_7178/g.10568 Transcript_7178/m.10568 type:complete len:221 (-) Transcript_7178:96-758(-)
MAKGEGLTDIGRNNNPYQEYLPINRPWKDAIDASIARSRKVRGGNFVQLATVTPNNEPRVRTVVFRGFVKDECIMKVITDLRSEKVKDIQHQENNLAELLWWFGKSSEQYRIRCRVQLIGSDVSDADADLLALRKEQWGNLSDNAREQFYWRFPGDDYISQCEVPKGGRDEGGKVLAPPENFLLVLLHPQRVDYLRLTDNYRQIDMLDDDKEWGFKRVNP